MQTQDDLEIFRIVTGKVILESIWRIQEIVEPTWFGNR